MNDLDKQVKLNLHKSAEELVGKADRLNLCQICQSFVPKHQIYTGKGEDVICDSCLKKHEGLAFLMCRCGRFLGFYKPGIVHLDSGVTVQVEPGDTLHTIWCPNCNPDETNYDIEEFKTLVLQANGLLPKGEK